MTIMFRQSPNTNALALQLEAAIRTNKRPQLIFYEFLNSGSNEANYLANKMIENKEVIKIICTPEGRAWVKRWLDDFFNYLQEFSK